MCLVLTLNKLSVKEERERMRKLGLHESQKFAHLTPVKLDFATITKSTHASDN